MNTVRSKPLREPYTYTPSVERLGPREWLAVWHCDQTGERNYFPHIEKTRKSALTIARAYAEHEHHCDVIARREMMEG